MLSEKVVKSLRDQNVYGEVIKGPTYSDWSKGEKTSSFDWKTDGHVTIVQREDGGIEMFSRKQKSHHVLWFPNELKDHFVVTFRVKNLNVKAGLLMALFHARGLKGESVFVPDLVKRRHEKSEFHHYKQGLISMYSISYYANTPNVPDRGKTHLRKNPAKHPVKKVDGGIPTKSKAWHVVTIVSARAVMIEFWIDDSLILSHEDKDESPYTSGWLGFRQMKWSHFAYSDLKIWDWGNMTSTRNVKRIVRSCVIF